MHEAKTRQAQVELLKQQAHEEALELAKQTKARKLKAKMLPLSVGSIRGEEEFVDPFRIPLHLLLEKTTFKGNALIDSGADLNVLSWEVWNALGQPSLFPTKM